MIEEKMIKEECTNKNYSNDNYSYICSLRRFEYLPTPSAILLFPVTTEATDCAHDGGAIADVKAFSRVTKGLPSSRIYKNK